MTPKKRPPETMSVPPPVGVEVEHLADNLALLSFPLLPAQAAALLTAAEEEVALQVYAGVSNSELAQQRGVSVRTVTNQIESIYRKLGVRSRVELVLLLRGEKRSVVKG